MIQATKGRRAIQLRGASLGVRRALPNLRRRVELPVVHVRQLVADVAAELKVRLLHHVAVGNDVVLDFGFWFRRQRDAYRALLAHQGIVPETVYIATSLETS